MQTKDELFLLIKSMTKNEKGYFRKFSGIYSPKGEGNYVRLFDCISRMDEYDDDVVKKEFKGEKILNQLGVTKYYLKNMIIRALRNYQEDQVPYIRNMMALADTSVMIKKGLFQSAANRIIKEKQLSVASEQFLQTLQWTNLQEEIQIHSGNWTALQKTAAKTLAERQSITDQYLNLNGYVYLKSMIIPLTLKKTGAVEKKLDQLLKHPLFSSGKMPLSNRAREHYTELLARIYNIRYEREKGIKVINEMIEWSENPKNHNPLKPFNYFILLNMLLNFMERAEAKQMAPVLDKCRKLLKDNAKALGAPERNVIQANIYGQEMRMNFFLYQPEAVLHSGNKLELLYKKIRPVKDAEIYLWLMQSIANVALKQFDKALAKLNMIFAHDITEQNYQLIDAYVLYIITNLELRNYTIVKSMFSKATYFVKKNYPDEPHELRIFRLLKKLAQFIEVNDKENTRVTASAFLKTIRSTNKPKKEFLEDWLETKI